MTSAVRLLVAAIASDDGLRRLLDTPEQQQAEAYRLAEIERVLPVIGARALRSGLSARLPEELVGYLTEAGRVADLATAAVAAYQANEQRTARLTAQLAELGAWLDAGGVGWVPLKGAAMLADGVWPDPAERIMTDLDILILDPGQVETAAARLAAHGLRLPPPQARPQRRGLTDRHQLPALVRDDWVGSVEIHRAFVSDEFAGLFPADEVLGRITHTSRGARLTNADLALHTIVHAQICDWGYRTSSLSLRAALDLRHLLSAEPRLAPVLHQGSAGRVRRAVRAQFVAAEALGAPGARRPDRGLSARVWWGLALATNRSVRIHELWRHVVLVPVFLRSDRMAARAGRSLGPFEAVPYALSSVRHRFRAYRAEVARRRGPTR